MSRPRVMRPILGASSRLRLEQFVFPSTKTAYGKVSRPSPYGSKLSICVNCSFSPSRQTRFASTDTDPPNKPPNGKLPNPEPTSSSPDLETCSSPSEPPPSPSSSSGLSSVSDLPSQTEFRRSALNHKFSSFMDRAQTTLFAASQRINDLTGYSGIETLKSRIARLESSLGEGQARLHAARNNYKAKVAERSATQREVTTLLARQKTWTPLDFEHFTSLYRQDYELEAQVADSAQELEDAERDAERIGQELSTGILARYHEEQIWSDKIRRMSTWGTWGLMGVNVLLFLAFQFGAEPWRRARLVRGFEEKVREALEEEREKDRIGRRERELARAEEAAPLLLGAVGNEQAAADAVAAEPTVVVEEIVPIVEEQPPTTTWRELFTDRERLKAAVLDLRSDRIVGIRMRDLSLIALEGVVGGMAVAGAVAILFVRRA